MPDQEVISFEIDPRSVLQAIGQMNQAIVGFEKGGTTANEKLNQSFQRVSELLLKMNDRSRNSMESLTKSIEKQAAAYGRSGVDKLIAQRDAYIKRLGDEEGMIKRVTAAYDKMIAAEGGGNKFQAFGQNLQTFVQAPLSAAQTAASGLMQKLGPIGTAVGIGATALVAFAAAGYEAAKSLGEYGIQIKDVELRTGLTAKEVGQFGFAARAVGQDVSIFERMMRGLTTTLEDMSPKGDKAREALERLNVKPFDLEGNLKPTADVLLQIGEGLSKLPAGVQADKAMMDIFKKSGIEAVPVMKELVENVKRARELGLGATDEDVRRWADYYKKLTEVDTAWEKLKREFKEPLAASVIFTVKAVGNFFSAFGGTGSASYKASSDFQASIDRDRKDDDQRQKIYLAGGQGAIDAATGSLKTFLGSGLQGAEATAAKLKQRYDEARTAADALVRSGSVLPEVARKHRDEVENARLAYERQSETVKLLQKDESNRIANLERARDLIREGQTFYQIGTGKLTTFVTANDIAAANQIQRAPSLFGRSGANPSAYINAQKQFPDSAADLKEGLALVNNGLAFVSPEASRQPNSGLDSQLKAFGAGVDQNSKDQQQLRLSGLQSELAATTRILELRSGDNGELATARMVSDLRQNALNKEYELTGDVNKLREQSLQNQYDLIVKTAEIEQKQVDTIKQSAETLFNTLFTKPGQFGSQLAATIKAAFLKPITAGFADITANALKPLIYGANGQGGISGTLKGLFGGKDSDPLVVANQNTKTALDRLSDILLSLRGIGTGGTGRPSLAGGGNFGSVRDIIGAGGGAGFIGMGGFPLAAVLAATGSLMQGGISSIAPSSAPLGVVSSTFNGESTGPGAVFGNSVSPIASILSGGISNPVAGIGPGGTSGFAGPIGALLRKGGSAGGFSGMLAGLKSSFWNENINTGSGRAVAASSLGGIKGGLAGVLTSPGAASLMTAAGVPLAMAGITGNSRGSWGGIGMSTAGGALTGAGIGTMILPGLGTAIGAGVGALAGFGIGLGEKLAGVEPQWKEAERLIKQMYSVSIDRKMGEQIAQLANSKYGGHVSIAVRDPDVRKMLELYAAGTGQKMPLSATTPRAGSLVEQGGSLYQAPTYQYGSAFSYQSNLPLLGGGSGGVWPGGGGSQVINASFNIDGSAVGQVFDGRTVSTVSQQGTRAMIGQPGLIAS